MRKALVLLFVLSVSVITACMVAPFNESVFSTRSDSFNPTAWVPVPHGWPRPTQLMRLKAGSTVIASANVAASPEVYGVYDWYNVDFGNVVIPNAAWTPIAGGKYETYLSASTTSTNGSQSFYYYFRWFNDTQGRDCFRARIGEGNSLDGASSLCSNLPFARISTQ